MGEKSVMGTEDHYDFDSEEHLSEWRLVAEERKTTSKEDRTRWRETFLYQMFDCRERKKSLRSFFQDGGERGTHDDDVAVVRSGLDAHPPPPFLWVVQVGQRRVEHG